MLRQKTQPTDSTLEWVVLGKVTGVFGIRGWVKIHSFTAPEENLFKYKKMQLRSPSGQSVPLQISDFKPHQKGFIAKFEHVLDRNMAETLKHHELIIERSALPQTNEDEHYWHDLVGLTVINTQGELLGSIQNLFETGANDVMIVHGDRERLIPFVMDHVIKKIDPQTKQMIVEWDLDF